MMEARITMRYVCLKCGARRELGIVAGLDGLHDEQSLIEKSKLALKKACADERGCSGCTKKPAGTE